MRNYHRKILSFFNGHYGSVGNKETAKLDLFQTRLSPNHGRGCANEIVVKLRYFTISLHSPVMHLAISYAPLTTGGWGIGNIHLKAARNV